MKKILFAITTLLILSSCSKTVLITQGEPIPSVYLHENYELTQLNPVFASENSYFGFKNGGGNTNGLITNFHLQNFSWLNSNLFRVLTFITFSAILPIATGIPINIIGGIPVGGALNNLIWSKTSFNESRRKANLKLIEENPNIDLFIYPKYNINFFNSLFVNKANVTIYSKGATLETNR